MSASKYERKRKPRRAASAGSDSSVVVVKGDVVLTRRKEIGVVRCIIATSRVIGLELTEGSGNCNGFYQGYQHFKCKPKHGKFIKHDAIERLISSEELLRKIVLLNTRSLKMTQEMRATKKDFVKVRNDLEESARQRERLRKKWQFGEETQRRLKHESDRLTDLLRLAQEELQHMRLRYDEGVKEMHSLRQQLVNATQETRAARAHAMAVEAHLMAHSRPRFEGQQHSAGRLHAATATMSTSSDPLSRLGLGMRHAFESTDDESPPRLPRMNTTESGFGELPALPGSGTRSSSRPSAARGSRPTSPTGRAGKLPKLSELSKRHSPARLSLPDSPGMTTLSSRPSSDLSFREIMSRSAAAAARKGQRITARQSMTISALLAAEKAQERSYVRQHKDIMTRSAQAAARKAKRLERRRGHMDALKRMESTHMDDYQTAGPTALLRHMPSTEVASTVAAMALPLPSPGIHTTPSTRQTVQLGEDALDLGGDAEDEIEPDEEFMLKGRVVPSTAVRRLSKMQEFLVDVGRANRLALPPMPDIQTPTVSEAEEEDLLSSGNSTSSTTTTSLSSSSEGKRDRHEEDEKADAELNAVIDDLVKKQHERGHTFEYMPKMGKVFEKPGSRRSSFLDDYSHPYKDPSVTKDRIESRGRLISEALTSALIADRRQMRARGRKRALTNPSETSSTTKVSMGRERSPKPPAGASSIARRRDTAEHLRSKTRGEKKSVFSKTVTSKKGRHLKAASDNVASAAAQELLRSLQEGGDTKEWLLEERAKKGDKFRRAKTPSSEKFRPTTRKAADTSSAMKKRGAFAFPDVDMAALAESAARVRQRKKSGRGSFSQPVSPSGGSKFMKQFRRELAAQKDVFRREEGMSSRRTGTRKPLWLAQRSDPLSAAALASSGGDSSDGIPLGHSRRKARTMGKLGVDSGSAAFPHLTHEKTEPDLESHSRSPSGSRKTTTRFKFERTKRKLHGRGGTFHGRHAASATLQVTDSGLQRASRSVSPAASGSSAKLVEFDSKALRRARQRRMLEEQRTGRSPRTHSDGGKDSSGELFLKPDWSHSGSALALSISPRDNASAKSAGAPRSVVIHHLHEDAQSATSSLGSFKSLPQSMAEFGGLREAKPGFRRRPTQDDIDEDSGKDKEDVGDDDDAGDDVDDSSISNSTSDLPSDVETPEVRRRPTTTSAMEEKQGESFGYLDDVSMIRRVEEMRRASAQDETKKRPSLFERDRRTRMSVDETMSPQRAHFIREAMSKKRGSLSQPVSPSFRGKFNDAAVAMASDSGSGASSGEDLMLSVSQRQAKMLLKGVSVDTTTTSASSQRRRRPREDGKDDDEDSSFDELYDTASQFKRRKVKQLKKRVRAQTMAQMEYREEVKTAAVSTGVRKRVYTMAERSPLADDSPLVVFGETDSEGRPLLTVFDSGRRKTSVNEVEGVEIPFDDDTQFDCDSDLDTTRSTPKIVSVTEFVDRLEIGDGEVMSPTKPVAVSSSGSSKGSGSRGHSRMRTTLIEDDFDEDSDSSSVHVLDDQSAGVGVVAERSQLDAEPDTPTSVMSFGREQCSAEDEEEDVGVEATEHRLRSFPRIKPLDHKMPYGGRYAVIHERSVDSTSSADVVEVPKFEKVGAGMKLKLKAKRRKRRMTEH